MLMHTTIHIIITAAAWLHNTLKKMKTFDLFFSSLFTTLSIVICLAWILIFANSIAMAGSFANWCNINGPMAGTGIALFVFVLAIFVCMAVGCIMWTKHKYIIILPVGGIYGLTG